MNKQSHYIPNEGYERFSLKELTEILNWCKETATQAYKKYETMASVLDWFRQRFKKWYQPDPAMKERLGALATRDQHEISCDEVFVVLDQFTEAVHRGENVLLLMPLVRQHLDVCPACREEYETLLRLLQPPLDS